jgi:hypothetical protein
VWWSLTDYGTPTVTVTNVLVGSTAVTGTTQLGFPQNAGGGNPCGSCLVLIPFIQVSGQTVINYTCSTGNVAGVYAEEWSGLGSSPSLDVSITANGASASIASGTTSATTKASELIVAVAGTYAGTTTAPTGSSWTSTVNLASGHTAVGHIIQTSSGATYVWNEAISNGGTAGWSVIIAAIAAASGSTDAIAGTASNTSTASGNTTLLVGFAGTAHNTSTTTATVTEALGVVGTAPNVSTASVNLTLLATIAGTASDASSAAGAFTPQVLAGTSSTVSTASGSLSLLRGLAGTASDVSSTTAAITLIAIFGGTASDTSVTAGDIGIANTDNIAGTAPCVSFASVTLNFSSALVSAAVTVSRATAFLQMSSGPRHPKSLGGSVFNADDISGTVTEVVINGTLTVRIKNGTIVRVTNVYNGSVVGWTMQEIDITLAEFNDETLDLTLLTSGGGALNITGYEIDMFLKTVAGSPDANATKLSTVTGEIVITNPTGGLATVAIPAVDLGATASFGFYRVDAVDTGGYRNTAIFGKVSITQL